MDIPRTARIERASGVSEVEGDGHTIRCVVAGTFQAFLESLRGSEVIGLTSVPAPEPTVRQGEGGRH